MATVSGKIQEPDQQQSTQHYDVDSVDIDLLITVFMLMPAVVLLIQPGVGSHNED